MRRAVLVVLALAVLGLFAWLLGARPFGIGADPAADAERAAGVAPEQADRAFEAEAKAASARLRGFPGLKFDARGRGAIAGQVKLHVDGKGDLPLPGVDVEALAIDAGRESRGVSVTDADGRFTVPGLPALAGFVLRAKHPPHADLTVRGLGVSDGRTTDAGVLIFGAPTTLAGSVSDGVGRPLSGAVVSVRRDAPGGGGVDVAKALRELSNAPPPLADAVAGADGRFLLDGLPPGRYVVEASYPGFSTAFVAGVHVTADGRSGDVRIVLDPGAGFEGRVVDETGAGIADAAVIAVPVRAEPDGPLARHETRSKEGGRYRLDTLTSGTLYFVEAHHDGRAPAGVLRYARGLSALDLPLVLGGRLEGTVTDGKSGAPVSGAEVLAVTGLVGQGTAPVGTVTDASGRYAFENVVPGPLVLMQVTAAGHAPGGFGYDAKAHRDVRGGETLVVDVRLDQGGRVVGTVRGDDGRPVPYAAVAAGVEGNRWAGEISTLSDLDGSFRLLGLKTGVYVVTVTAPGWASPTKDEDVRVSIPQDGAEVVKDFTLSAGCVVEGKVTTPAGDAVPAARVTVVPSDVRRNGPRVRDLAAVSDGAGAFRVYGVPAGVDLVLQAEADAGVRTATDAFRLAAGETKKVTLVLKPGAKLVGRATDAAGRPVAAARVRCGHVEPGDLPRLSDSYRADSSLSPRVFTTDDGGGFVCDRMPAGPVILKIEADGYASWYRRDLVVPPEGDLAGVTAVLEGASTVRGRVLAADTGRGIGGAWVAATTRPSDGAPADDGRVKTLVSTESAADGSYVLERVPPGAVDVVVWFAAGYVLGDASCHRDATPAGASGVDFRLVPVPPAGDPPAGR